MPEVGPRPHEVSVDELFDVGAGLRGQPELEGQTGIVGGGEAVSAHGHGVDGPLPLLEVGREK